MSPQSTAQSASILTLPLSALPSAASLRDIPGLEVAIDHPSETVYLRAPASASENLPNRLLTVDATLRARATESDALIPIGKTVPVAQLPSNLDWHPLSSSPPVTLPPASHASTQVARVPIRLVRSEKIHPAFLLTCPFQTFYQWGMGAPAIRLAPLRFAVSDTGGCIVVGTPLPPFPGTQFAVRENVACPLGFTWHPNIPPKSLLRAASAAPGDIILFHDPAHLPIRLPAELFLPANRASLRATIAQL